MTKSPREEDADRRLLQEGCPSCGAEEYRSVAVHPELEWVSCTCGLVYKRWEIEEPEEIYDAGYFESAGRAAGAAYSRRRRRRVAKSRSQILDALAVTEPGTVLDVGCSLGYALDAARSLGLEARGVDVSEHAVAACRERGLRADLGALDSLPVEDGSVAIVLMKHVLEHTPRPREALAEVRRVLRPGGALFVAVPHVDYWKAARRPQRHRYYLPEAHGREHYLYYRPETLRALLAQEGFATRSVHPRLLHPRGPLLRRAADWALLPLRWPFERLASALSLRKEFWLTAVRAD